MAEVIEVLDYQGDRPATIGVATNCPRPLECREAAEVLRGRDVKRRREEVIRHIDAGTPEEEREALREFLRRHLARRSQAAEKPAEREKVPA